MKTILSAVLIISAIAFSAESDSRVVKLVTRKDWKQQWTATAFFVSENRLLTAAHTFKNSNDQWIVIDGKEIRCKVVKIDFKKDIAVLESDARASAFYRLSSKVFVKGFPLGGDLVKSGGFIDDKRVHSKAYFANGMSGGPVENESGEVIGMGVQGDSESGSDACRFIPASALAEFLK